VSAYGVAGEGAVGVGCGVLCGVMEVKVNMWREWLLKIFEQAETRGVVEGRTFTHREGKDAISQSPYRNPASRLVLWR